MNILYLHDTPISSERANVVQVLHMCRAFSNLGHKVTLATPGPKFGEERLGEIVSSIVGAKINFRLRNYRKFTVKGKLSILGGAVGAMRVVQKSNADLCFVRNPIYVKICLKNNIPTIFESHNGILSESNRAFNWLLVKDLLKIASEKKLSKFVTISSALENLWKNRGVPAAKLLTLHDGVDAESYLDQKQKITAREELGLPLERKIVLYAGSLYPNRGIDKILKLAPLFPSVVFFVLGGPEDQKNYYERAVIAQSIRNIQFVGHIPHHNVKNYLWASDVLLMIWTRNVKTIDYCSPLKMFEYMASGRPIVGHGFPTIKEVLIDGETAFLVDPDSFNDLVNSIEKALNLPFSRAVGEAARKLVLEKYTWAKRAKSIMDSLEGDL